MKSDSMTVVIPFPIMITSWCAVVSYGCAVLLPRWPTTTNPTTKSGLSVRFMVHPDIDATRKIGGDCNPQLLLHSPGTVANPFLREPCKPLYFK